MTSQQMPVEQPARGFSSFAITFAVVFSVVYFFAVHYHLALFSYGPATGEFGLFNHPASTGATMLWYGFVATSTLAGAIAGAIVSAVTGRSGRIWSGLAWLLPVAALVGISYLIAAVGD